MTDRRTLKNPYAVRGLHGQPVPEVVGQGSRVNIRTFAEAHPFVLDDALIDDETGRELLPRRFGSEESARSTMVLCKLAGFTDDRTGVYYSNPMYRAASV